MSKIRCKNTKPELILRKSLWNRGYRYRLNVSKLPGRPDIVFRKYKLVIFVDGEFWHGFNWQAKKKKIKSNREYWIPKIEKNILRDERVNLEYENMGWKVMRFWSMQVMNELNTCLNTIECNMNRKF